MKHIMTTGATQDRDNEPPQSPRCLSTLEPLATEGLSKVAQWDLAGGRRGFPSTIDMVRETVAQYRVSAMQHMSISGMQDKISVRLHRGALTPVATDGTHILKPIPQAVFSRVEDTPANEALTMLIARRSGITTAAHGLIRLANGDPAYITRRFDRLPDGARLFQEDLGSLAGMTEATHGKQWKYSSSYEALGNLVGTYCSARLQDLDEFFSRVVFCFVIGNGDAHVRNFSVLRERDGFVRLSPAYDLLCTRVHLPEDADLGLDVLTDEADARYSASFQALGHYSRSDFTELGRRIGLPDALVAKTVQRYLVPGFIDLVSELVGRSFLSAAARASYLATVNEKTTKLSRTFKPG